MNPRALMIALFALLWPVFAVAAEQINEFDVDITVLKNGDIIVSENSSNCRWRSNTPRHSRRNIELGF